MSFEAHGDPINDAITFDRNRHKIVIIEGLYLLHQADGSLDHSTIPSSFLGLRWADLLDLFDYKIYLNADLEAGRRDVEVDGLRSVWRESRSATR